MPSDASEEEKELAQSLCSIEEDGSMRIDLEFPKSKRRSERPFLHATSFRLRIFVGTKYEKLGSIPPVADGALRVKNAFKNGGREAAAKEMQVVKTGEVAAAPASRGALLTSLASHSHHSLLAVASLPWPLAPRLFPACCPPLSVQHSPLATHHSLCAPTPRRSHLTARIAPVAASRSTPPHPTPPSASLA